MINNKPNIVFLFADDQRFDTIAALGNRAVQTPNLDQLVGEGVSFTQTHIPSGTVGAICMPSRAMLHTGRTLFHLDGAGESIPREHTMLGEALQGAGYRTFGTGKWHNGPSSYARSFTDGGEVMFGGMADHWNVPMCHFDASGAYECSQPFVRDAWTENTLLQRRVDHVHFGRHSTDILADFTVDFIENYDDTSPFFAYTSFLAPHDPRTMPEEFRRMYNPDQIELPASFAPEHPFDYGQTGIRDEVLERYPRPAAEVRRHIAEYYAMISHLDAAIGRIILALKKKGVYENTIIVFAGDNGLAVGKHGLMGKQNHYEHSIRVPLIFAGPGLPRGETRESYAYLLDIYPTLCDLTGMPIPESVEGRSLGPTLTDPSHITRDRLYFAYADLIRSAKDDRHKLILYSNGERNYAQLFDFVTDPDELTNLVAASTDQSGQADSRLETLYSSLLRMRDEWGDRDSDWGTDFWRRFERNGGLTAALSAMQ